MRINPAQQVKLIVGDIYGDADGNPNCVIIREENDDHPQAAASIWECYELGQYGLGINRLSSMEEEWHKMTDGVGFGGKLKKEETLFWHMDTGLLELIVSESYALKVEENLSQSLFEILKYKYKNEN